MELVGGKIGRLGDVEGRQTVHPRYPGVVCGWLDHNLKLRWQGLVRGRRSAAGRLLGPASPQLVVCSLVAVPWSWPLSGWRVAGLSELGPRDFDENNQVDDRFMSNGESKTVMAVTGWKFKDDGVDGYDLLRWLAPD